MKPIDLSIRGVLTLALLAGGLTAGGSCAAGAKERFTVAAEIGIADFGDLSHSSRLAAITWSPDRKLVAVVAARGKLAENKVEVELRIYAAGALRHFAHGAAQEPPPQPVWSLIRADYKEGPVMEDLRWTPDSSALAFRLTTAAGGCQLMYADLKSKSLTALSGDGQRVTAFDVADRTHYAYAAQDPAVQRPVFDRQSPAAVLTGRSLDELLFPLALDPSVAGRYDRSNLWVAAGSDAAVVVDPGTGQPIVLFQQGLAALRLSPDGRRLFTAQPVAEVPVSWSQLYLPPSAKSSYRPLAGPQYLDTTQGQRLVNRYVLIDVRTGATSIPVDSPTGAAAAWWTQAAPAWSADGREIAVGNLFVPTAGQGGSAALACVAVIDATTNATRCVEPLKRRYTEAGKPDPEYDRPVSLAFDVVNPRSLTVDFQTEDEHKGHRRYVRAADGTWTPASAPDRRTVDGFALEVQQSADNPPVLAVSLTGNPSRRVVWDPNPQLAQVALGTVEPLHWRDATGREWSGGLYEPADYRPGTRYPLVIQTHGFFPDVFRPSGLFPTGYAARALAASGIVVLETRCAVQPETPEEGTCQANGYEAAVKLLAAQGVVDPDRVGIVGFSRTCYYVMEALTRSPLRFSAATITDGVNEGYWQYIMEVDAGNDGIAHEANAMNAAVPWGPGLATWLKNSPLFNTDKIATPLQIVGEGMDSVLSMWEPYALLRYQHKPVDLVVLNTAEHVLTTPAVRLASQGGTVDWMRFWLQGYEDPDPRKREQYHRWESLCDGQTASSPGHPVFCVRSPQVVGLR